MRLPFLAFTSLMFCALGAGIALAEERVVAPVASCPVLPGYPAAARDSGVSGKVVIQVQLDALGAAKSFAVAEGMGEVFDPAALESARHCHFTAAQRGELAVPSTVLLTVAFTPPPPPATLNGVVLGPGNVPLAGARVSAGGQVAFTDAEGKFSLPLELGADKEVELTVQKEGFRPLVAIERLLPGQTETRRYALAEEKIAETRVISNRLLPNAPQVDRSPQVSRFEISRADIDRTPGALEDVSHVIQDLPGVAADPDLLATFYVRGGGPDEVVYSLDGVPLSNPFHLGGFATLFNPMLIDTAEFFAGGAPARYQPALSGVLEVHYPTAAPPRPKVMVDVSMHTAKARVDTPTGIEGLSLILSARRSYFELYFAGLRALKEVGQSYAAPDLSEYFVRAIYQRGHHLITATLIEATDGLSFLVKPGEEVLVNFAGGLNLANSTQLGLLRDQISLPGEATLSLSAALTRDVSHVSVSSATVFARDSARLEGLLRADLVVPFSEQHRLEAGVHLGRRSFSFDGQFPDTRASAVWASKPFVDEALADVDIHPNGVRTSAAVYLEHRYHPVDSVELQAGGRVEAALEPGPLTYTARVAGSWSLPTATVLKASAGVAAQAPGNPLLLDPVFGNPRLLPERALQAVVGMEQPLPFEALLRIEAWTKWLDQLVVNPDSAQGVLQRQSAGVPVFASLGTGRARGLDALLLGRTRHFSYGLALGLLYSERNNPLADGAQSYPSPWDQRYTAAVHLSYSPSAVWIFSGRLSLHSGRPVTPVVGFVRDEGRQKYLPVFGETNSGRYPGYYELSLRAERHFKWGPLAMAWYAEVLNVTNAQNLFATVYDAGDFTAGTEPGTGAFNHLPIRPFLGIRGEF